jgi:hypothetical protein
MAYTSNEKFVSCIASTDMRSHQFKIVDLTTTFPKIDLAAARKAFGVLANNPNAGEGASVVTEGETMVMVGAAVSVGDWITSAATGFGAATTSSVDQIILGRVKTAAASGMLATVDVDVLRVGPIA